MVEQHRGYWYCFKSNQSTIFLREKQDPHQIQTQLAHKKVCFVQASRNLVQAWLRQNDDWWSVQNSTNSTIFSQSRSLCEVLGLSANQNIQKRLRWIEAKRYFTISIKEKFNNHWYICVGNVHSENFESYMFAGQDFVSLDKPSWMGKRHSEN